MSDPVVSELDDDNSVRATDDEDLATLRVTGLPENTSDDALKLVMEEVLPVEAVYVEVNFDTRTIFNFGYISYRRKYSHKLSQRMIITVNGIQSKLNDCVKRSVPVAEMKSIKDAYRPPVADWPHDIRPGHPDFLLSEPINQSYDLDTKFLDRSSAHCLVDDVLLMILKYLKVCELLRIERTCRRWQWIVRKILGGHKFVNLADNNSIWGDFTLVDQSSKSNSPEPKGKPYFGPSFVQKVLLLNSTTLEHLIICGIPIDVPNVRRAIDQCCQSLNHCFYMKKRASDASLVGLKYPKLRFKFICHHEQSIDAPKCVCKSNVEAVIDQEFAIDKNSKVNVVYESKLQDQWHTTMYDIFK